MGFLEASLGNAAAFCVGTAAVALGAPPAGAIEASVGAAGLIGFVLGRTQKFGPECHRVRGRIQGEILQNYRHLITGSDGSFEAGAELQAADEALKESLGRCVIDRRALAASAVSPAGFPAHAVIVVMTALGEERSELFGAERGETLAYRFAHDLIRAGIEAAIADADYYRQLEPELMFEMAKAIGWLRETLQAVKAEQQRQGEVQRTALEMQGDTYALLQQMAAQMGIRGGGQALDAEVSRLEQELNATRSDLLALLSDIVGQGITADQMASALTTAKANLEKSRAELEQLRGLANEVPEIESHLAAARAALDNRHQIDLAAAQEAIREAGAGYRQAILARRRAEAVNMARLYEAEASIALARSDFLEAARLFGKAADELPEAERHLAAGYRFKQAYVQSDHGDRFGGLTSLRNSVDTYRKVLTVFTEKDMPADWALTLSNLGAVLVRLGKREGGEVGRDNLKQAVDACTKALTVRTEKDMPTDWAGTMNVLGSALDDLGEYEIDEAKRDSLKQAVDVYTKVLAVCTEKDMPIDWARTLHNLGCTLFGLSECEAGEARHDSLKQVVDACTRALTVRTKKDRPAEWAMTMNVLGAALSRLGEYESDEARRESLRRAVDAFTKALTVYTKMDTPADWALTLNNLGETLAVLAEHEGCAAGRESLRQAVEAYRAALTVFTESDMPAQWAVVQKNLDSALKSLDNLEYKPAQ